jgi:hypothetical protein
VDTSSAPYLALDLTGTFAFALNGALIAVRMTGSTSSEWSRSG